MISTKKMPLFFLLFLTVAALLPSACKKNEVETNSYYPAGITKVGNTGQTDCNLDRCDSKRNVILKIRNVEGIVSSSIDPVTQEEHFYIKLGFPGTFDSSLNGDCCNFIDELRSFNGRKVRFSGECRDACRELSPTVPTVIIAGEENFFLTLSKIDTI